METINKVDLGEFVTDGNGGFAHVKENENGVKYYAHYELTEDDDALCAVLVSDLDVAYI